jgi:predicted nuclease of predicted toxin-antitoxin system
MSKRVLLDEGVPRHLAAPLQAAGFSATPYPQSWKQATNGELLQLAERHGFNVLITSDKNIYAQQNLRGRNLSIIVLPTNLRRQVMERAADIADTLKRIKPRQYVIIESSGRRLIFDFDAPGSQPSEMPAVKPLDNQ